MDYTSRMVALLRELRRERNGAVADSMRYYGTPYGLNYGVSLPTLRRIARAEAPDHGFARYLYRQDVRELRLAALHIACPACFTPEEFPAWAAGIVNSEIAEEAAFALLSRAEAFPALFSAWIASPDALLQYAALLAAARETGCIVTTEEHSIVGGLGAAVASFLAERCPVPVLRHGVRDVFGRSGKAEQVLEAYGLTPAGIVETARAALELKR